MKPKHFLLTLMLAGCMYAHGQAKTDFPPKKLEIKKLPGAVKLDGDLNEAVWKDAAMADDFIQHQPTPFLHETTNKTQAWVFYNNEGIYVAGYMHENNRDSIAAELTGSRDGFGNNDFFGMEFDTYYDKLNGFEFIITPKNEQWDSKVSNGGNEDFSWNAVWQSAVKMQPDGWSCEIFIPYSAIRFGKKKVQDWGFNLFRNRNKAAQKFFWQSLDPNVNGFLPQEGVLAGLEDIKPPLRLQLSPYFSTYYNKGGEDNFGVKDGVSVNGGMDIKYGLNQAFTLDMTLIPDFGQVQTDDETLNLSPFERKYAERRPFFTEGTELFNKGNLFYSRRIGGSPIHAGAPYGNLSGDEQVTDNPAKSKIVNATKISGRTQKGLGIGFLNAITNTQYATIQNSAGSKRKYETDPLTNYNVFVLDQTLKHNSSISFVNTSVLRSGADYDADVAAALFSVNDKTNTWNVSGGMSISNIIEGGKTKTGYYHDISFGKTSGKFNFNIENELLNAKYDKGDLGYFTNNNSINNSAWAGYFWNTPKGFYNRLNVSGNIYYARLVSPIDFLKRKEFMFNTFDFSMNANAQTKKLWELSVNAHIGSDYNDFYESRDYGRVWRNKGSKSLDIFAQTNTSKKISGYVELFAGDGGYFHRTTFNPSVSLKVRFSSKFSVENSVNVQHNQNAAGFADIFNSVAGIGSDQIYFSRRNVEGVENVFSVKYSISNRMGLNLRLRHSYTKVAPRQIYELGTDGYLTPAAGFDPTAYNVNYNFLSGDMIYNWQFAQGSFLTIGWKDIGLNSGSLFYKNYFRNLGKVANEDQYTSFSVKLIYFFDYAAWRVKSKVRKQA